MLVALTNQLEFTKTVNNVCACEQICLKKTCLFQSSTLRKNSPASFTDSSQSQNF